MQLPQKTTLKIVTEDGEYYADVSEFAVDIDFDEFGGSQVVENREITVRTDNLYERVVGFDSDD